MSGSNVLLIGNSSIAQRRVLPALDRLLGIREISIATSNSSRRKTPNDQKITKIYDSYENALAACDAPIVYISTINGLHEELATKALDLGRHVIVDKPAFLSLETSQRLVKKASQQNVLLAEATVFLDHPIYAEIAEISEKSDDFTRVVSVFSMPPFTEDNFRYHKSMGGGAINDLGPYAVATSRFFMRQQPKDLTCSILAAHPKTGVDISFSLMAEYEDGKSLVGLFGFDTEYQNFIHAFGPQTSLSVERAYTPPPDTEIAILVKNQNQSTSVSVEPADSFELAITNMLQAIESRNFNSYYEALLFDAEMLDRMRKSTLTNNQATA
jgi:predicted dehydrogenase